MLNFLNKYNRDVRKKEIFFQLFVTGRDNNFSLATEDIFLLKNIDNKTKLTFCMTLETRLKVTIYNYCRLYLTQLNINTYRNGRNQSYFLLLLLFLIFYYPKNKSICVILLFFFKFWPFVFSSSGQIYLSYLWNVFQCVIRFMETILKYDSVMIWDKILH